MEKPGRDKESVILGFMNTPGASPAIEARRSVWAVPRAEIAYFHAILEGYDDLAVMRTIRPDLGHVEVYVSPGRDGEFAALMDALRNEGIALEEVSPEEEGLCGS